MSSYKQLSIEQKNDMRSGMLIDSWSYSKVSAFARNEKAFEMNYIFNEKMKMSASTIAGSAYHESLRFYFDQLKNGELIDLATLLTIAYEYIDGVGAQRWKLQKTTPTIEEAKAKASSDACKLLSNFVAESAVYTDDISEVLEIETKYSEWISINGVDIPLPCTAVIDMRVRTVRGTIAIIDHKSKSAFTSEEEMSMSIGVQAITYAKVCESATGERVDEVWFVENKISTNRDGSPQLNKFMISLNEDTRRLYESLLYEPLRRMVQAVSDPDYVYLINNSDTYTDRAEVYSFWCKTMICEIGEFNIEDSKKPLIEKRLKKIRDASLNIVNPEVIRSFQRNAAQFIQYDLSNSSMTNKEKIEHVLRTFGVICRVAHELNGYSVSTYLLEVSAGVKISSIHSRRLEIANALDVANVRVSTGLVVYGGKSYVGIEVSVKSSNVLAWDPSLVVDNKVPIGVDPLGNVVYWNLGSPSTPHALVCGATGSGKSVFLKSTMEYALLMGYDVIVLDPKHEFGHMSNRGVRVVQEIDAIEVEMALQVDEMNDFVSKGKTIKKMIVFDEFADAVANARSGNELNVYETFTELTTRGVRTKRVLAGREKSLEENMRIILQKGRSVGIRVVAATQRASTKIITGDAKVNFPIQICFRVPKETDSRVVLDESGAESLGGNGDGLMKSPDYLGLVRFQGFYKK